jgi:hypothetical protein
MSAGWACTSGSNLPPADTAASLGPAGIRTRDQGFLFPRYARELDAPEG